MSPSPEGVKIGLDKALNNLNPFGPALKGLGPDSLQMSFPPDVSLTPRPRQNLPRTLRPSTDISTEPPRCGVSNTNIAMVTF